MRTLFTLLSGVILSSTVIAQGVITRIGSDGTQFYYNGVADLQTVFEDALANGLGVDTVLLPGGTFLLTSNLDITSPVVVIGSGIRSDSAVVYGGTTRFVGINVSFVLHAGADSAEFHGLTFEQGGNSPIYVGSSLADSDVDDVRFVRCVLRSATLGYPNATNTLADDIAFQECVINEELNVTGCTNVEVRNSFIHDILGAYSGSSVSVWNCVIMGFDGLNGNGFNPNVLINYTNSVFLTNAASLNVTENAVFTNNLFVGNNVLFGQNLTFGPGITPTGTTTAASLETAFPTLSVPAGYTTYQFNGSYTLELPFVGTDGEPLGVYGGTFPWKDGSLPFNPHWIGLDLNGSATQGGLLPSVRVQGSAQTY